MLNFNSHNNLKQKKNSLVCQFLIFLLSNQNYKQY